MGRSSGRGASIRTACCLGAIVAGAVLTVSQVFAARPWQAGFAAGVLLAFLGALALTDGIAR